MSAQALHLGTEAAVRFHRYRKSPFFGYDIANGPLFLTTRFRSHRFRRQIVDSAWRLTFRTNSDTGTA
jgi:hypothetical protein